MRRLALAAALLITTATGCAVAIPSDRLADYDQPTGICADGWETRPDCGEQGVWQVCEADADTIRVARISAWRSCAE